MRGLPCQKLNIIEKYCVRLMSGTLIYCKNLGCQDHAATWNWLRL